MITADELRERAEGADFPPELEFMRRTIIDHAGVIVSAEDFDATMGLLLFSELVKEADGDEAKERELASAVVNELLHSTLFYGPIDESV